MVQEEILFTCKISGISSKSRVFWQHKLYPGGDKKWKRVIDSHRKVYTVEGQGVFGLRISTVLVQSRGYYRCGITSDYQRSNAGLLTVHGRYAVCTLPCR